MNKIEIQDALKKDKIVLFMKGTRNFPQCGFSGRIVDILGQFNVEYQEYDVLQDSEYERILNHLVTGLLFLNYMLMKNLLVVLILCMTCIKKEQSKKR